MKTKFKMINLKVIRIFKTSKTQLLRSIHHSPELEFKKMHIKLKKDLRKRSGKETGSETKATSYLQPLFSLLLTLDGKNKWVCALLGDFQFMLLLFAVFRDVCNVATLER